jgi:hypothetical protein
LGIWFSLHRRQAGSALEANRDSQIDQNRNARLPQVAANDQASPAPVAGTNPKGTSIQRRELPRNLLARNKSRGTRMRIRPPELTPQELAEKEQVLVALRLVSAKLNLAQRKTQVPSQPNMIRNQHKIG